MWCRNAKAFGKEFSGIYINRITSSEQRATVLSFKGLSYNICYGLLGVLYALLIKTHKQTMAGDHIDDAAFIDTFFWFPALFVIVFICLQIFQTLVLKRTGSKG